MEEIRIVRASPKGVWITKASLRGISLVFCIAIFGIAGSVAAPSVGLFVSVNFMPLAILAPSTTLALCMDIAELITIFARSGHRGLHPASHVSVELLIWLGYAVAAASLGLLGYAAAVADSAINSSASNDLYGFNRDIVKRGIVSNVVGIGGQGQALIGLAAVNLIIHFVLFIFACVETSGRNRRTTTVTAVPHGKIQYAAPV